MDSLHCNTLPYVYRHYSNFDTLAARKFRMNILTFVFIFCIVVLLAVHALSAVQLYKQRSLGPYAVPSILVLSGLWAVGLLSAVINFASYLASIS